jgi:hypothetical protein
VNGVKVPIYTVHSFCLNVSMSQWPNSGHSTINIYSKHEHIEALVMKKGPLSSLNCKFPREKGLSTDALDGTIVCLLDKQLDLK